MGVTRRTGRIPLLAIVLLAAPCEVYAAPSRATGIVRSETRFTLDLYSRLASKQGNICFSPDIIYSALAMIYDGAAGETAQQMEHVLSIDMPAFVLHDALGRRMRTLKEDEKNGGYSLSVANAIWAQKSGYSSGIASLFRGRKGAKFSPPFLTLVHKTYSAGFSQVDFKKDVQNVRALMNFWVEEKTAHKIRNLILPGALSDTTRLVLVNAVCFKGDWSSPFEEDATTKESFRVAPGKEVRAPLMYNKGVFDYYDNQDLQVLSMPYRSVEPSSGFTAQPSSLSMVVILPRETYGLEALERILSAKKLGSWLDSLGERKVEVYFPKFKMTQGFHMDRVLRGMGMKDAFDKDTADFSRMNGKKPPDKEALNMSAVLHAASLEVSELGAEAAAATGGVTMEITAALPNSPSAIFLADHPFLFLIRDENSGNILFFGRVTDPTAG